MAINTFPAVASPVKSVQRGSAGGAGTVTITSVDISKSMVNIFGTASSGTVSASFGMSMNSGTTQSYSSALWHPQNSQVWTPTNGTTAVAQTYRASNQDNQGSWSIAATVNAGNAVVNAGSNNLVAAVVQGYLSNSTSLVVSGACRYEVVEFN
jgi:hypothetical protein